MNVAANALPDDETGAQTEVRTTGVAVNGVKFEPGTAETVTCDSGETLRVEALQDINDLGLDFNNAHVQPTGEYHYHGASELLADADSTGDVDVEIDGTAADAVPAGPPPDGQAPGGPPRTATS